MFAPAMQSVLHFFTNVQIISDSMLILRIDRNIVHENKQIFYHSIAEK